MQFENTEWFCSYFMLFDVDITAYSQVFKCLKRSVVTKTMTFNLPFIQTNHILYVMYEYFSSSKFCCDVDFPCSYVAHFSLKTVASLKLVDPRQKLMGMLIKK